MSGDEIIALLMAAVACLFYWGMWVAACFTIADFGRARRLRLLGIASPVLALSGLFAVLRHWASVDVRNDGIYLLLYMVLGAAWLGIVRELSGTVGLPFRDDWLERHNPAAAVAGTGVLFAGTAAFAGANIGEGPGWWVVVFCALLSTGALFACWWGYAQLSGADERVSVDRDVDAGIRLGSFLAAVGVIAGRAVAGDWHGAAAAVGDFLHSAWPLLPYAIGSGLVERRLLRSPSSSAAATFASMARHCSIAALYLLKLGPWA